MRPFGKKVEKEEMSMASPPDFHPDTHKQTDKLNFNDNPECTALSHTQGALQF